MWPEGAGVAMARTAREVLRARMGRKGGGGGGDGAVGTGVRLGPVGCAEMGGYGCGRC